jgi:16S rRNA (cytosine1402-N4)-methyltransferase
MQWSPVNILLSDWMGIHIPVLLHEVLECLSPQAGDTFLDCTFGGGGHTRALLEKDDSIKVVALDRDPRAEERASGMLSEFSDRLSFVDMNFRELEGLENSEFDGILFDLGVSSFQLDEGERGFSFREDAPLDMRMDPRRGLAAADWLESVGSEEIVNAIRNFGEEKNWRSIVRAILSARGSGKLNTTAGLVSLIEDVTPERVKRMSKINPATRSFQGIRIAVNEELAAITNALPIAFEKLKTGGVVCVISFHSLEDRIVKRQFRRLAGLPVDASDSTPMQLRDKKAEMFSRRPIMAGEMEQSLNPRSRSAKMRALKKL